MSITLRFVTNPDLISRVIRGAQMGFWASHVEARMPDGTLLGSRAEGGVQARPADYDANFLQELFVDLPCTQAQADAFHTFLRTQIGVPYDYEAIAEMAQGELTGATPGWDITKGWICSALIQSALISAGIVQTSGDSVRLTTPRDVFCQAAVFVKIPAPHVRGAQARAA